MINEPLFQNDILEHIIKYLSYYLGYGNWFIIFCSILLFLYICYKFLMHNNNVSYAGNFPKGKFCFSIHEKRDIYALIFLILCTAYNIFGIIDQEMSFFSNYDTRGSVIPLFEKGGLPMLGVSGRFYPLSFWDTRILYAITHNFYVINTYVNVQSVIIVILLNYFLQYIPIWKRFLCIGLIMISPAVFSINSIIYSERLLLMYIIGSFICMKKYSENPNKKFFLWFTILLINCALYSKESCVLFYSGILAYFVFGHIWYGRIIPQSFLTPIKTAKKIPFETLLFLSLLFFVLFYGCFMASVLDSKYVSFMFTSFSYLAKIYCTEIIITLITLFLLIKALFHKNKYSFLESCALGTIIVTAVLIFVLKIAQQVPSMAYKSYYLIIPNVVGLIYIYSRLKNKYFIVFLSCAFFAGFTMRDYTIHHREDGFAYREVADFIMSGKKAAEINVFMSNHAEPDNWQIKSWFMPYKYYWPDAHIKVFSAKLEEGDFSILYNKYPIFYKEKPDIGDLFLIRKGEYYTQDLESISLQTCKKIFENDLFEVYSVQ